MFRNRRAKIKASTGPSNSSSSASKTTVGKAQRRNRIDFTSSYEDDEQEEADVKLKVKDRKKRIVASSLSLSVPGLHSESAITDVKFKAPELHSTDPQIMNLEDLDDGDESDEALEGIPSSKEIDSIRKQRARLQQEGETTGTGFYGHSKLKSSKEREREYVDLMDQDDKRDLMETLDNGRGNDTEKVLDIDLVPNQFEDAELALSRQDLEREKDLRKRTILEALDDFLPGEWEAQQINKIDNKKSLSMMPRMHQDGLHISAVDADLEEVLLRIQNRKKLLHAKRDMLQRKKDELVRRQEELISKLGRIAS